MTWLTKAAQAMTWACILTTAGLFASVAPLPADGQTSTEPSDQSRIDEPPKAFTALLAERRVGLVQHTLTDLDGDGDLDVVAHVEWSKGKDKKGKARAESALWFALTDPELPAGVRVLAEIQNGMLCSDCPIPTRDGAVTFPEQQLRSVGRGVEICETWGQDWRVGRCDTVVLAADETLRVQRHLETAGWQPGPTESSVEIDFEHQDGQRAYSSSPLEAGFPTVSRNARFAMLVAPRVASAPTVDGKLDDEPWRHVTAREFADVDALVDGERHWKGREDLSFRVKAAWTKAGLWVAVSVTDDRLDRDDCSAERALVRSDRVELWLDTAADLRVAGNESWVEEHRRVYHEDPVRHRPDDALYLFAFGLGQDATCAAQYLPREDEPWLGPGSEARADTVRGEVSKVESGTGYRVEVLLPVGLFGVADMTDFNGRWPGTGLTVVVNDVDDAARPQDATQMATSTLTWGDPFTLGLVVMPAREDGLPVYPFDWSDWMR